jgi:hypothetical protein
MGKISADNYGGCNPTQTGLEGANFRTDVQFGQHTYRELGGNYFDERDRTSVERRLVRRLQKLGYNVTIQPTVLVV